MGVSSDLRGANLSNRSLQPFSHDYDLASHTTLIIFVNFIHELILILYMGLYSLRSIPNDRCLRNFS